jgi:hypothetical protein
VHAAIRNSFFGNSITSLCPTLASCATTRKCCARFCMSRAGTDRAGRAALPPLLRQFLWKPVLARPGGATAGPEAFADAAARPRLGPTGLPLYRCMPKVMFVLRSKGTNRGCGFDESRG